MTTTDLFHAPLDTLGDDTLRALRDLLINQINALRLVDADLDAEQRRRRVERLPPYYPYTIRHGDTLAGLVEQFYGDTVRWQDLAEYNELIDPNLLFAGDTLRFPAHLPRRPRLPLDRTIQTNYYQFGDRYRSGRWAGKPHPGVDLCLHESAPVYAIGEGTVVVNKDDPSGYGHYLMISHTLTDGREVWSLYAHLQHDYDAFVSPSVGTAIRGLKVAIGRQGHTGAGAGGISHLHLEIKRTPDLERYGDLTDAILRTWYENPLAFLSSDARIVSV